MGARAAVPGLCGSLAALFAVAPAAAQQVVEIGPGLPLGEPAEVRLESNYRGVSCGEGGCVVMDATAWGSRLSLVEAGVATLLTSFPAGIHVGLPACGPYGCGVVLGQEAGAPFGSSWFGFDGEAADGLTPASTLGFGEIDPGDGPAVDCTDDLCLVVYAQGEGVRSVAWEPERSELRWQIEIPGSHAAYNAEPVLSCGADRCLALWSIEQTDAGAVTAGVVIDPSTGRFSALDVPADVFATRASCAEGTCLVVHLVDDLGFSIEGRRVDLEPPSFGRDPIALGLLGDHPLAWRNTYEVSCGGADCVVVRETGFDEAAPAPQALRVRLTDGAVTELDDLSDAMAGGASPDIGCREGTCVAAWSERSMRAASLDLRSNPPVVVPVSVGSSPEPQSSPSIGCGDDACLASWLTQGPESALHLARIDRRSGATLQDTTRRGEPARGVDCGRTSCVLEPAPGECSVSIIALDTGTDTLVDGPDGEPLECSASCARDRCMLAWTGPDVRSVSAGAVLVDASGSVENLDLSSSLDGGIRVAVACSDLECIVYPAGGAGAAVGIDMETGAQAPFGELDGEWVECSHAGCTRRRADSERGPAEQAVACLDDACVMLSDDDGWRVDLVPLTGSGTILGSAPLPGETDVLERPLISEAEIIALDSGALLIDTRFVPELGSTIVELHDIRLDVPEGGASGGGCGCRATGASGSPPVGVTGFLVVVLAGRRRHGRSRERISLPR